MKSKQIIVIGGGITGRFAKIIIPEAIVLEKMDKSEPITSERLGGNVSRLPVPELEYDIGFERAMIDGKEPRLDLIKKYRVIHGNPSIGYGDVKQFLQNQPVYFVKRPDVEVRYKCSVTRIRIIDRTIEMINENGKEEEVCYGCIISTIPLSKILDLVDIFKGLSIEKNDIISLPRKTIYYREEMLSNKIVDDNVLLVDYSTDTESIFHRRHYCGKRTSIESFFRFEGATPLYPGKIFPSLNAEEIAKDLQLYSIYCYGRYARWRYQEHIHETFKNLRRFCERKGQIGYS